MEYVLVFGAVPFTIIERDGLCSSIITGKTTTGIVAAR
jgi:hypothetical protein